MTCEDTLKSVKLDDYDLETSKSEHQILGKSRLNYFIKSREKRPRERSSLKSIDIHVVTPLKSGQTSDLPQLSWRGKYIEAKDPKLLREEAKGKPTKRVGKRNRPAFVFTQKENLQTEFRSKPISKKQSILRKKGSTDSGSETSSKISDGLKAKQHQGELSDDVSETSSVTSETIKIKPTKRRRSKTIFVTKSVTHDRYTSFHRAESSASAITRTSTSDVRGLRLPSTLTDETTSSDENVKKDTVQKASTNIPPDLVRSCRTLRNINKMVPELKSKPNTASLLKAYLCEEFFDMQLKGPNSKKIREMYKKAISKERFLHNLILRNPDILPSHICHEVLHFRELLSTDIMQRASTTMDRGVQNTRKEFSKTFQTPSGNIMIELENEIPIYAFFYKQMIKKKAESIEIPEELLITDSDYIRRMVQMRGELLREHRHIPGVMTRYDIMIVLAASDYNQSLIETLSADIEGWLDQLIKSMEAKYRTIREETCIVLSYMMTRKKLMDYLYDHRYHDVLHDITAALLRAMEDRPDTFDECYIVICHLMENRPARSIITCLLERCNYFRNVDLICKWPRFLYYALRYWPPEIMSLAGHKILSSLEAAFLKPISNKAARTALAIYSQKAEIYSPFFTIAPQKDAIMREELTLTKSASYGRMKMRQSE